MTLGIFLILICSVTCFDVPDEWKEQIYRICCDAEKGIFPHPSMDAQRFYSWSSDAQVPPQVLSFLMLPAIVWCPIEQYGGIISTQCPKCDTQSNLHPVDWTDGRLSDNKPRLLHCVNSNTLLISRIYSCPNNHRVLGHHPDIIHRFTRVNLHCFVPFHLWHISGFTSALVDFIENICESGMPMVQIEQLLLRNRARLFYSLKESFLQLQKVRFPESTASFPDFEHELVKFWKAIPTRHSIEGAFLQIFWQREPTYSYLMSLTSLSSDCWLSCDHTFKAVSNIGSVRLMDNKWVKQYTGLFCILNAAGNVLTWKMTKALSFEHTKDVFIALQTRLQNQRKQVEEFYIDNCCSWRSKLQEVFGLNLKVYLDIFHAIQRVSQKMPKRHPYHFVCLQALRMVFRDPTDHGDIRTKPTPSPKVIRQQLLHFQSEWEGIKYNDRHILPPAAIKEIKCLLVHVDKGCISGIYPGRGTNKNERLHRDIKSHMTSTRYGVELSYAILTKIFFSHNEGIDSRMEKRIARPITAYGYCDKQNREKFGLSTPPEVSQTGMHPEASASLSKIEMKRLTLQEVLDELNKVSVHDLDLSEAQVGNVAFYGEEALDVLKQAVSAFYVSLYMDKLTDTAVLNAGTFYISFLALIEKLVGNFPQECDDSQIDATLSSWNLKRVNMPGDGNCLFMSIAFTLIQQIEGGDAHIKAHMLSLGVPEMHLRDVGYLSKFLRTRMVVEWHNNLDFYQGFITNDLNTEAQHFLEDGHFSSDAGDLMVLTLANILLMPFTIFTSISNMPVLCILPTLGPTISSQPIFLAYNQNGPGHYDCAIPLPASTKESESKAAKCTCGRKPNYKVPPCTTLKCKCYRSKVKCTSACICKACANVFGMRPLPSTTRRRNLYDNQRQPLEGRNSVDFLTNIKEAQNEGNLSLLEALVLKIIITFFILQGLEVSANNVFQAFKMVQCLCDCCNSVEFPLLKRNLKKIEQYLSRLHLATELLKQLVKMSH